MAGNSYPMAYSYSGIGLLWLVPKRNAHQEANDRLCEAGGQMNQLLMFLTEGLNQALKQAEKVFPAWEEALIKKIEEQQNSVAPTGKETT